jgi:hypothetical protein
MARQYRYGAWRRLLNRFTSAAARRGRGPATVHLLTVSGRRTGEPHTTPVHVIAAEGERWLVAPVLRRYIADVPITRPYFDASADSPLEAIAAEAGRHPVFRLVPPPGEGG